MASPVIRLASVALYAAAIAAHAGGPEPLPAAAPASSGFSAQGLEDLHRFMRNATGPQGYLGGVTLIARDGKIVDWRAYGHRDLARKSPMDKDAIFRIYSMTKTVTSVAVLMLAEEGKIALDDPIGRHLPELAKMQLFSGGTADAPQLRPSAEPITIRELLTHTAGFPAGLKGDEPAVALQERADPHGAADLRGFVERLSRAPLAAEPGTRFGYDGAATEVLARLVEAKSGENFAVFLRKRLFGPLRMGDTDFSVPESKRDRIADLTRMGDDGRLALDGSVSARHPGEKLNAYDSGAGGLYSTAADYARFCQMLLNGGELDGASVLGRKTVDMMMSNQLTMLDPPVTQFSDAEGFGFGGAVVIDAAKSGIPGSLGRFGWPGAASTTYTIDRRQRLVAIMMLQHLPREGVKDLPRISRSFYGLVYEGLAR
ncbi:beta-lactamase family protein [Luteimonas sp. SX5]|uniref:Beta-lactamase family protein n=1 Tax=Luteimonas galliterrae TaxID=2940486 RepID=A0ABT0MJP0_9GAMM|nr:serine hydrolase domain-containing protein [Luteimonas galliterrae]MCL1635102.1 beta-lactamase family protein [Luteimonas galliterrae]